MLRLRESGLLLRFRRDPSQETSAFYIRQAFGKGGEWNPSTQTEARLEVIATARRWNSLDRVAEARAPE